MIRKQVYLQERQEALLKRRARAQGTTEADLIRRSLDRTLTGASLGADDAAWQRVVDAMDERSRLKGSRRTWRREDLYERP
jgi:hypothetical protein